MSTKHKLSIADIPICVESSLEKGYAPYRKRRYHEGGIRRTVSQNKDLHERGIDMEREKMLRGRSVSCPVPLQHIYYAYYLYIDKFKVEKGDDYECLFI